MTTKITRGDGFEVRRVDPRIFMLTVTGNLSRAVMAQALAAIWAMPDWQQPWGLVVTMTEGSTYDSDILRHEIPSDARRAVGTTIVTTNVFHRMMVNSVGIGLRLARFHLTGHATEEEGIDKMAERVREALARKRSF